MSSIASALKAAAEGIARAGYDDSPFLDAEVLLAHCLGHSRAWLLGNGREPVSEKVRARFDALVAKRIAGQPVAYLVGQKEFWSIQLKVSPSVLIPRPETELLVERVCVHLQSQAGPVLDLGTGSGAIALAIAGEFPQCRVTGTDSSAEALAVAKENAATHSLSNLQWVQSHWFDGLGSRDYQLIASNPPYIAPGDPHLQGEVRYEPVDALVAARCGLADLEEIITGAPSYLQPGGWLLVEHGFEQGEAVRELFAGAGFDEIETHHDLAGLPRLTEGHT